MTAVVPYLYLLALLVPTACMALLDRRFRLVLWRRAPRGSGRRLRAGAATVGIGIVFFLAWDVAAIASGHYAAGQSPGMTGIMLAPELPLEEIVFITFLSYLTLVLRGLVVLVLPRARSEDHDAGRPAARARAGAAAGPGAGGPGSQGTGVGEGR